MKRTLRFAGILLSILLLASSFGCLVKDTKDEASQPSSGGSSSSSGTVADLPAHDHDAVAHRFPGECDVFEDGYNGYIQFLAYYGMGAPTDDATIDEYVQTTIEELLSFKLPLWKAKEQGIELTAEELAEVDVKAHNDADAEYNDLVVSYANYYTDSGEAEKVSDLTAQQLADALVYLNADVRNYYGDDSVDIDFYVSDAYDNYYQNYLVEAYSAKLRELSDASVVLDDETLENWYFSALANQKELFDGDATLYRTYREESASGLETSPLLYVPENLAAVQIVTLTPEGTTPPEIAENLSKMTVLEAEYGKLALAGGEESRMDEIREEYADLQETNKKLTDEFFAKEYARIKEMKTRLDSGEEYDAVAADDASFLQEQILCYKLDFAYPTVITDAVSKLNDGETSDILFDGTSYYLVHLVGKLAPGNADRSLIEEAIRNAASAEKRDAAWEELVASWEEEAYASAVYYRDAYAYIGH